MAETVILIRRSNIQGSVPPSGSLKLGELALNIEDGGVFYHDSGSDTPTLIRAGSASFATSASFAETASFALNAGAGGGGGDGGTSSFVTLTFGTAVREIVQLTSSVIASASQETGSINLGRTFILHRISGSAETRVRIYSSESFRDADTSRAIGTDPTGEHDCFCH